MPTASSVEAMKVASKATPSRRFPVRSTKKDRIAARGMAPTVTATISPSRNGWAQPRLKKATSCESQFKRCHPLPILHRLTGPCR